MVTSTSIDGVNTSTEAVYCGMKYYTGTAVLMTTTREKNPEFGILDKFFELDNEMYVFFFTPKQDFFYSDNYIFLAS